MQQQNAHNDTFVIKQLTESAPGMAQTPTAPCIDADIEAILELQERIGQLWESLAALTREDLSTRLELLSTATDQRATDSRPVREALQQILLSIGTGALAVLSEPTRQRLTSLTGIALPGHLSSGSRRTESFGDV